MPVSAYYGGSGRSVMRHMKRRYGEEKGERVFYATAQKHGLKPARSLGEALTEHRRAGAFRRRKR